MQAQIGANYAGHPEDASGPEVQALVQFGYNINTNQITVLSGLQTALVQSLWTGGGRGKGLQIQIQESLQALGGVINDATLNSRSGQFQAQIGVQLLVKVGPVWIGVQGTGGVTLTHDSPMDFPGAGTFVVQW